MAVLRTLPVLVVLILGSQHAFGAPSKERGQHHKSGESHQDHFGLAGAPHGLLPTLHFPGQHHHDHDHQGPAPHHPLLKIHEVLLQEIQDESVLARCTVAVRFVEEAHKHEHITKEQSDACVKLIVQFATQGKESVITTLSNILSKAVGDDCISHSDAVKILSACLKSDCHKEANVPCPMVLKRSLEICSEDKDLSDICNKLKEWAAKRHPCKARESLTQEAIIAWLKADLPEIESDFGQLKGKACKDVQTIATLLKEAVDLDLTTKEKAVEMIDSCLKSLLSGAENEFITLCLSMSDAITTDFIAKEDALKVICSGALADLHNLGKIGSDVALKIALSKAQAEGFITSTVADTLTKWNFKSKSTDSSSSEESSSKSNSFDVGVSLSV